MRNDSPITVLAGEALPAHRRILFNGTNWMLADAYEKHDAITGDTAIDSGAYGAAYAANDDGIIDINAAGSIAAGAKVNGKDDGKCDDDGSGIPIGINTSTSTITSGNDCPVLAVVDRRGLLNASVADSAAVGATGAIEAADKSFTIPANTLKAGDVIDIWSQWLITGQNGTDTFVFTTKIGSQAIAVTGTIDPATSDIAVIHTRIQIRTAGASGTFVASTISSVGTPRAAAGAADIPSGDSLGSTTIDTTAAQAITNCVTCGAVSGSNTAVLKMFQVMHHTK